METLTNSKIAKQLGINKTTIKNYIDDAVVGKNNLELTKLNNKVKLIDSFHNLLELKRLVEFGKKYRPTSNQKNIIVRNEFYNLFDIESQFEIIRDLEIEKQIDLKYYYYKEGAYVWKSVIDQKVSLITIEIEKLLKNCTSLISNYFENQEYNLIDVGCGNGQPADLIIEKGKVNKYIACDISPDILNICTDYLSNRFPNLDINISNFDFQKVSVETHFDLWTNRNPNLFMLIGNTICNYNKHDRYYLLNSITRAMSKNDMFLISYTLNTDSNKSSLNYVKSMLTFWLPSLLGIDVENLESEARYNDNIQCKELSLVLDKAYQINFQVQGEKKTIQLEQGERINLWKHYIFTLNQIITELEDAGLQISFTVSTDSNILLGCKLITK
jgi:uncharacterized SAM-dependent methyltransferase